MTENSWKLKQDEVKLEIKEASDRIISSISKDDFYVNVRERWGVGERLYNLFWWDIKIDSRYLRSELKDYTDILLVPYRIDRRIIEQMACVNQEVVEVQSSSWGIKEGVVHLDPSTGNVHPVWSYKEWDGLIKQLILVKNKDNGHLGPRFSYAKGDEMPDTKDIKSIVYRKREKRRSNGICSIAVPEVCYYPFLLSSDTETYALEQMLDAMKKNITM